MSYGFDGSDDRVRFALGALSGYVCGPITLAYMWRRTATAGNRMIGGLDGGTAGSSAKVVSAAQEDSLNRPNLYDTSAVAAGGIGTLPSSGNWAMLVVTWAGPGTAPRFHTKNSGGAWAHNNGASLAPTPTAPDYIFIGQGAYGFGAPWQGEACCFGIDKTAWTDAQVEALSDTLFAAWLAAGFDWLVGFEDAGTLTDLSGNGGDESSRVGVTQVSDPPGWDWEISAPTIREVAALASSGTTNQSSIDVTLPSSRAVGDLLLIDVSALYAGGGTSGFSASGWTVQHIRNNGTSSKAWLYRICDGTESSPVTVTQTGTSPGSTRWKARAIAITAGTYNSGSPFDSSSGAGTSSGTGVTAFDGGSVTPSQPGCLSLVGATCDSASVRNITFDSPAVELYDDSVLNQLCTATGARLIGPVSGVAKSITGTWSGTTKFTAITLVIAPLTAETVTGAADLTGSGSLSANADAITAGSAALTGTGTLTADGTVTSPTSGEADLTGLGTLEADATVIHPLPVIAVPEMQIGMSFGLFFGSESTWEVAPTIVYGPDDNLPPPTYADEPPPDPEDIPPDAEEPTFPEEVDGEGIAISFTMNMNDAPDWTIVGG